MAVNWRTSLSSVGSVAQIAEAEGGADFVEKAWLVAGTSQVLTASGTTTRYHSAVFGRLNPDTKYVYRVGDGRVWSEWNHFRTAVDGPAPFSFVYYGDTQNATLSMCARVMRETFAKCPTARFTLHAGDLVNIHNSDDEWGEWFDAAGWINRVVPVLPVVGNHEYGRDRPEAAVRLTSHWNAVFNLPSNGPEGLNETVYHVDYQCARIVVLNSSECRENQAVWLESVLSNNPYGWTIVAMHHPVYSATPGRDNVALRDTWQPIFDRFKVDLVLQGHDHSYARSGLMRHDTTVTNGPAAVHSPAGTVYVVSVAGPKMYRIKQRPFMQRSIAGTQLFQIITVDQSKLHLAAYTATGNLQDAFTIVKHPDRPNELVELPLPIMER